MPPAAACPEPSTTSPSRPSSPPTPAAKPSSTNPAPAPPPPRSRQTDHQADTTHTRAPPEHPRRGLSLRLRPHRQRRRHHHAERPRTVSGVDAPPHCGCWRAAARFPHTILVWGGRYPGPLHLGTRDDCVQRRAIHVRAAGLRRPPARDELPLESFHRQRRAWATVDHGVGVRAEGPKILDWVHLVARRYA